MSLAGGRRAIAGRFRYGRSRLLKVSFENLLIELELPGSSGGRETPLQAYTAAMVQDQPSNFAAVFGVPLIDIIQ